MWGFKVFSLACCVGGCTSVWKYVAFVTFNLAQHQRDDFARQRHESTDHTGYVILPVLKDTTTHSAHQDTLLLVFLQKGGPTPRSQAHRQTSTTNQRGASIPLETGDAGHFPGLCRVGKSTMGRGRTTAQDQPNNHLEQNPHSNLHCEHGGCNTIFNVNADSQHSNRHGASTLRYLT